MIDLTFRNIYGLFVLSFKAGENDSLIINHFLINPWKTNKKPMKNFPKCEETIIIQQEPY